MGDTEQEATKARRRLGRQRTGGTFDAFISYSHSADTDIAPALREGLHKLAKPWYRLRATRVFLDETSMAANPGLWSTLTGMLANTEYFILLASPEAAASPWVQQEVGWWCANKPPNRLVIGLTRGDIAWDGRTQDFAWTATTALPPQLRGAFAEEPRYIDLRQYEGREVSLADAAFRDDVADFAAVIRDQPKDELLGDDVRLHRRAIRQARTAILTLIVLLIASVASCTEAGRQRNEASRQRDEARAQARRALSRQLAAQSAVLRGDRLDLSLLLSVEAMATDPTPEAEAGLLAGLAQNPQLTYSRALPEVQHASLAADPTGGHLAWGTATGIARWDVAARAGQTVPGLTEVDFVAISPTGVLAASGKEGTMLWDSAGAPLGPILAAKGRLAFSTDGGGLAVMDRTAVTLWDVATRERQGAPVPLPGGGAGTSCAGAMAASADLRLVAFAPNCTTITILDVGRRVVVANALSQHSEEITSLAFSPDGSTLASGSGRPPSDLGLAGSVRLWDVEGLQPRRRLFEGGSVTHLAFSPSGGAVAAATRTARGIRGEDGVTIVADTAPGSAPREPLRSDGAVIQGIAFGSDGSLATVSSSSVALWTLGARDRRAESLTIDLGPADAFPRVDKVVFSPDGGVLAVNTSFSRPQMPREVTLWDAKARRPLGDPLPGGHALEFSADGGRLAIVEVGVRDAGRLTLWDVAGREQVGPVVTGAAGAAFSPDGTTVAVGRDDGSVLLWDPAAEKETGVLAARPPMAAPSQGRPPSLALRWLSFGPDGTTLLTGREDGLVTGWDLDNGGTDDGGADAGGTVAMEFPTDTADGFALDASDMAFSPDHGLVAISVANRGDLGIYGSLALWDVGRQRQLHARDGAVADVAFTEDGRRFVAADPGGSVWVWDVGRLRPVDAPVLTARGQVNAVSLAPDGRLVAGTSFGALLSTIDPAAWRTAACAVFGTTLGPSESEQFLGSPPQDGCA